MADNPYDGRRELVLNRRGHRWVFRYTPGEEAGLLRSIADLARDTQVDFDWFDAAVLSHQMGDLMQGQLKHMLAPWAAKP